MTVKRHCQPGEPVPEPAVYAVIHDGHRAIHMRLFGKRSCFPSLPNAGCDLKETKGKVDVVL